MVGWSKRDTDLVIVGTDSGGDSSILKTELKRPVALILGNEAKGMSVNLKRISDMIVSIPLSGVVNSLNVACAGTILFWQVSKNSGQ
jgi:23S rRNA (uridine2479-2'-O)-methyltransferase